MNLFARILSHGFALVVVALLAIGLIYRGELFPEYHLPDALSLGHKPDDSATHHKPVTDQATVTEPVQPADVAADVTTPPEPEFMPSVAIDRGMPEPATTGGLTAGEQTEAAESEAAAGPPPTEKAEEPAVAADTAAAQQEIQESIPPAAETQDVAPRPAAGEADIATQEPEVGIPVGAEAPEPEVAGSVAEGVAEVAAPAATTFQTEAGTESTVADVQAAASHAHATPAVTPYRVLAAAREAYWLRDYAAAEQKYQELIALDPGNPDGYGELGNMYFSQGDWEKASAAYYEAGTRLAAQGMYERARQLVEVIRGLNGGQAGDLEQQIDAAESAVR